MAEQASRYVSSGGLVVGSFLGIAGTFAHSTSMRGLLWGLDGIFLIVAAALLAIYYHRKGSDMVAAGFLVYLAGQTLVLASAAMNLHIGATIFGAGVGLWAAALFLMSGPEVVALWVRIVGVITGILFLIVALRIFMGHSLTAMTKPLPFYAYPALVVTLLGWAWHRLRDAA